MCTFEVCSSKGGISVQSISVQSKCPSKQAGPAGLSGGPVYCCPALSQTFKGFLPSSDLDCRRRSGSSSRAVASTREAWPTIGWSFFHTGTLLSLVSTTLGPVDTHGPRDNPTAPECAGIKPGKSATPSRGAHRWGRICGQRTPTLRQEEWSALVPTEST